MFPQEVTKTYLAAVSFGPDSMALLAMLIEKGYNLVVCHVNYHKRKESDMEEKSLTSFCHNKNIPLYVHHAGHAPQCVNFQAWARDIRYRFFGEIYVKVHAVGLFVAHQEDDDLETYLMQKSKKKILSYYGIRYETTLYDMKVYRPLLSYRKNELRKYCDDNHIPYAIDSSNEADGYERNRIRHHQVQVASLEQRALWKHEKEEMNSLREKQMLNIQHVLQDGRIDVKLFLSLTEEERMLCLHECISSILPHYALSKYKATMMIQAAESKKPNWHMLLEPPYSVVKAYNEMYVQRACRFQGFYYQMEEPSLLDTPYFCADFRGDTSNRNIFSYDYPLVIRTFEPGDALMVKSVKKTLRRLFIDWKMPLELRDKWPIFVNCKGEIVYVPRYRHDFKTDSHSNLIVKCKLGI